MTASSCANEGIVVLFGLLLLSAPFYAYYQLICVTHATLYKKTLRTSVLACRTAIFLPAYSSIMWVSLALPSLYLALQIPISIAEGFCFLSFFAMLTSNLGGAAKTSNILTKLFQSGKTPLCGCCCPGSGTSFYIRVYDALWHFLNTRTVFVAITSVLQYVIHFDTYISAGALKTTSVFAYLFTCVTVYFLGNGFGSLVMFYEMLYTASSNLSGTFKILLLKFSVGLIVVQGLVEEFLFASGYITVGDSDTYTAEQRAQRYYCLLVIFEYAFLSIAVYYAYSTEILPPSDSAVGSSITNGGSGNSAHADNLLKTSQPQNAGKLEVATSDSVNESSYEGSGALGGALELERAIVTFGEYVHMIFAFRDVFDDLELARHTDPESLTQPLTVAGGADEDYHQMRDDGGNVV